MRLNNHGRVGGRVWHPLPATLPACARHTCRTLPAYYIPVRCTGALAAMASVHPHITIDRPQRRDSQRNLFRLSIGNHRAVLVQLRDVHQATNLDSRGELQPVIKPLADMLLADLQRRIDVRLNQRILL